MVIAPLPATRHTVSGKTAPEVTKTWVPPATSPAPSKSVARDQAPAAAT